MNTHVVYLRHPQQTGVEPSASGPAEAQFPTVMNHLAVSRDPSLRSTQPMPGATTASHVAWIRPTEVHAYAGHAVGRGLDLHAELMRRARRSPRQLTRTARQLFTRTGSATNRATDQEGIQL